MTTSFPGWTISIRGSCPRRPTRCPSSAPRTVLTCCAARWLLRTAHGATRPSTSPRRARRWTYRKVNLASSERGRLVAGSTLPVLSAAIGGATVGIGVQLCREIRFPEQWHVLARSGAQLLAYLTYAANPREPAGVWRSHLISRAAETQRYVVAANVAHADQHCPSMIVSPRGDVLAEAGTTEPSALRHELELGDVSDWYVSQQRSDVVGIRYLGESDRG
ncbi:MAG TPA: carbon-nitrogen hydrolase family protein [Jatrophihabitans sp.]|nr:carbon-nitrogen hydrolase family protein [Jatrophihabitans sp.]